MHRVQDKQAASEICLVNARCSRHLNCGPCGAPYLEALRPIDFPDKGRGRETMTTQIIQDKRYPNSERAERMQDLLLVASFGLWAALLGLSPVLAFRLLVGS